MANKDRIPTNFENKAKYPPREQSEAALTKPETDRELEIWEMTEGEYLEWLHAQGLSDKSDLDYNAKLQEAIAYYRESVAAQIKENPNSVPKNVREEHTLLIKKQPQHLDTGVSKTGATEKPKSPAETETSLNEKLKDPKFQRAADYLVSGYILKEKGKKPRRISITTPRLLAEAMGRINRKELENLIWQLEQTGVISHFEKGGGLKTILSKDQFNESIAGTRGSKRAKESTIQEALGSGDLYTKCIARLLAESRKGKPFSQKGLIAKELNLKRGEVDKLFDRLASDGLIEIGQHSTALKLQNMAEYLKTLPEKSKPAEVNPAPETTEPYEATPNTTSETNPRPEPYNNPEDPLSPRWGTNGTPIGTPPPLTTPGSPSAPENVSETAPKKEIEENNIENYFKKIYTATKSLAGRYNEAYSKFRSAVLGPKINASLEITFASTKKLFEQLSNKISGASEIYLTIKRLHDGIDLKKYSEKTGKLLLETKAKINPLLTEGEENIKVIEEKLASSPETFEGPEYETLKREYDPLYDFAKHLRIDLGVDNEKTDIIYSIIAKAKPNPQTGELELEEKEFSNYHDALKYLSSIPSEERTAIDTSAQDPTSSIYNRPLIRVSAKTEESNFWGDLEKIAKSQHSSSEDLITKIQTGQLNDKYEDAKKRGELIPEMPTETLDLYADKIFDTTTKLLTRKKEIENYPSQLPSPDPEIKKSLYAIAKTILEATDKALRIKDFLSTASNPRQQNEIAFQEYLAEAEKILAQAHKEIDPLLEKAEQDMKSIENEIDTLPIPEETPIENAVSSTNETVEIEIDKSKNPAETRNWMKKVRRPFLLITLSALIGGGGYIGYVVNKINHTLSGEKKPAETTPQKTSPSKQEAKFEIPSPPKKSAKISGDIFAGTSSENTKAPGESERINQEYEKNQPNTEKDQSQNIDTSQAAFQKAKEDIETAMSHSRIVSPPAVDSSRKTPVSESKKTPENTQTEIAEEVEETGLTAQEIIKSLENRNADLRKKINEYKATLNSGNKPRFETEISTLNQILKKAGMNSDEYARLINETNQNGQHWTVNEFLEKYGGINGLLAIGDKKTDIIENMHRSNLAEAISERLKGIDPIKRRIIARETLSVFFSALNQ